MEKSNFLLLMFLFVGFKSICAQNSDEIYSQQEKVIRTFYQLLLQDSPVTVSQANEVFFTEDLWNIEYYSDSLSDQQKNEFYYGDSDTLVSRTFKKIRSFIPGYIFPFERSALTDSGHALISQRINIDFRSDSTSISEQREKRFQYHVTLQPTMHWWVTFEFYKHPNQYISKIILKNGTNLLNEIGLTK